MSSISRSAEKGLKYKEYFWKIENKRERASIPLGFLGNLSDYEWTEHRKYPGYYICREGFIKKGNRLLAGSINKDGYIIVQIQGKSRRIHRVIMEHFLGRDLKDDEVIDHVDCVRHNNNISNLRVTDRKGNMNNPLTVKKFSRSLVVADLFGNFISYETIAEIYNRIRSREGHDKSSLLKKVIIGLKYLCIELEDKSMLYKKMESVVYVFNKDKTEVLGAFESGRSAGRTFTDVPFHIINLRIKSKKPAPDGNYYLRGPEAVKLVLSLGHGTAGDYKPE